MLDVTLQETVKRIKADRVNLRLSDKLKQDLENFCNDKKINSRSKVCKEALNFCLNNESEIEFKIKSHNEQQLTVTEIKEVVKEKTVLPSFIPAFYCISCTEIHQNEAYASRVKAYCKNCGQFAKEIKPRCVWCRKDNTILPLQEWYLDKIGIPYPNEIN